MKKILFTLLSITILFLTSCSDESKIKSSIEDYLQENLKNPKSMEFISLTVMNIDSVRTEFFGKDSAKFALFKYKGQETSCGIDKIVPKYITEYMYSIINSDNKKVIIKFRVPIDDSFHIIDKDKLQKNINGDYGIVTGNVYWLYNNYVGNKPDVGSTVTLYSIDSVGLTYETTVGVDGNYNIPKVISGEYYVVINSKNTNDKPSDHISSIRYSGLLDLFGYDIEKSNKKEFKELDTLESLFYKILCADESKYGGLSKQIDKYTSVEDKMQPICENIIKNIPSDIKSKLGLYTGYANSINIEHIFLGEDETKHIVTDFGITYF